jgi:hypothetical protein
VWPGLGVREPAGWRARGELDHSCHLMVELVVLMCNSWMGLLGRMPYGTERSASGHLVWRSPPKSDRVCHYPLQKVSALFGTRLGGFRSLTAKVSSHEPIRSNIDS